MDPGGVALPLGEKLMQQPIIIECTSIYGFVCVDYYVIASL